MFLILCVWSDTPFKSCLEHFTKVLVEVEKILCVFSMASGWLNPWIKLSQACLLEPSFYSLQEINSSIFNGDTPLKEPLNFLKISIGTAGLSSPDHASDIFIINLTKQVYITPNDLWDSWPFVCMLSYNSLFRLMSWGLA